MHTCLQAPGIGPKIAATLLHEYGTLSNLFAQADNVKQKKRRESLVENAEKVRAGYIFFYAYNRTLLINYLISFSFKVILFRKLVALDDSIPTDKMTLPSEHEDLSSLRMTPFNPNR